MSDTQNTELRADWRTGSRREMPSLYTHLNHVHRYLSISTKYVIEGIL